MSAWLLLLGSGCPDEESAKTPYQGYVSSTYQDDGMWLCKPGLAHNLCDGDIDATEVLADGSFALVAHQPNPDPPVDCFYIYPTVDLDSYPGNHTDPQDLENILDPLMSQAARFNSLCRVYAPFYRQATVGCYLSEGNDEYFDLAYRDVLDSFMHYMANFNQGRDLVIIGHSQGTMHLTKLMQMEFDTLPELRKLLVSGLLIGQDLFVPPGEVVGGSFQNLPICQTATETGCVISYNIFAGEFPPETAGSVDYPSPYQGMQNVCVNPAAPQGGKTVYSTFYPTHSQFGNMPLPEQVTEPFALFKDFYYGECTTNQHGFAYLKVSVEPAPGDLRENPVNFEEMSMAGAIFGTDHEIGLHLLDYNLPLGNLLELVETQINNR